MNRVQELMPEGMRVFFFSGMLICSLMVLVNLALVKTRGPSALALSAGFVVIGVMFWMLANGSQPSDLTGLGAVLIFLLGLDAYLRIKWRLDKGDAPR